MTESYKTRPNTLTKLTAHHHISLESTLYKSVGRGMVKLLEEPLERNLNEGNLNTQTLAADS